MVEAKQVRELDNSMMVTMTRGELAKMVSDILDEKLSAILGGERDTAKETPCNTLIFGTANIAAALGINRNTFYSLWDKGAFGNTVFHIGRKVAANRAELLKYVAEHGEGYNPKD